VVMLAACSLWPVAYYEVYGPEERLGLLWK
jgi:hypothetical protein